jgi:predicted nuclease of predicted toxin-antitoxin system
MRLLADENVPLKAIELLRKMGYDVLSISESTPQACDRDIMMLAEEEGRILLTFDKDFGELAFNSITKPFLRNHIVSHTSQICRLYCVIHCWNNRIWM